MRKWVICLAVMVLLAGVSISVYAWRDGDGYGPGRSYYAPGHMRERDNAGYVIHRTAGVIYFAQEAAERGSHYFGLGAAVAHQQKARDLYWDGAYREAIWHSLRARDLAFQVISANNERPHREYYRDEMEESYSREAPRDNELDIQVNSIKVGKDNALVNLHLGLDISK